MAGINYCEEDVGFERTTYEGVVSVGAVVAPALASLVLFYLRPPPSISVTLGALVGPSLRVRGYRAVYGLARAVSECRFERTRDQSVSG